MLFKIYHTPSKSTPPYTSKQRPTPSLFRIKKNYLLFSFLGLIFIVAVWKGVDFLELNETGELVLSTKRKAKLEKNLKELEEGEQYALIVVKEGLFPCYSCLKTSTIQLFPGQIWKYGVTSKGEQGRYKGNLPVPNLLYKTQFVGMLQDCYMEEQRKIFSYALLPENTVRDNPLIRPPGNKYDK